MIRKAVPWLVPVLLGAVIASQWQDIIRYVKIKTNVAGAGAPAGRASRGQNGLSPEARQWRARWHGRIRLCQARGTGATISACPAARRIVHNLRRLGCFRNSISGHPAGRKAE